MPSPRPIHGSRRPVTEQSPPYVDVVHQDTACRVCGGEIRRGDRAFLRPYVIGRAHVACGWFPAAEAVDAGRHERTTCAMCGEAMYIKHVGPGPWATTAQPRCLPCCLRAMREGA